MQSTTLRLVASVALAVPAIAQVKLTPSPDKDKIEISINGKPYSTFLYDRR